MALLEVRLSDQLPIELKKVIIEESRKAVQILLQKETPWAFKEWLTLKEAQQYLGISWQTLNQWRERGLRVSEMSPRNIFVHKEELNRFLREFER
ncbi:helix-turn-helix domain-containing protein [Marinilactibacillus psychrotolerans]|uniref:helix-turn-helix domain-containing protein n=1 Tax=Marinilactibacillus psychrotolerans TaxID=191770 RepID=UPI003888DBE8